MEKQFEQNETHKKAQQYELFHNNNWENTNGQYQQSAKDLLIKMKDYKQTGAIQIFDKFWFNDTEKHTWINEFFHGSKDEFLKFNEEVKDKNNLEIGSGPCGLLNAMYWLEKRNIIEPLISGYKANQIKLFGESWFNDEKLNCFQQPAEILIDELVGKIDGFIVCRNCLDHTQDWKAIMENIALYAASGCKFLFWADLFHLHGTDAGHFNITNNKEEFKQYVNQLGFVIESEWSIPENERGCINIGFVGSKIDIS